MKLVMIVMISKTPARRRPTAMLDIEDVVKAVSYPMDVLRALTPDQLDRLSFLGFPERHDWDLELVLPSVL